MKNKLIIYNNNKNAPKPNIPLTPGACAVIINKQNKIFLHKRSDSNAWSLPGGKMQLGESISRCCLREIREETNIRVTIKRLIGIYTSPKCIFDFGDGKIFQSFVVAFLCHMTSGTVKLNKESGQYQWFEYKEIANLDTLPFVKEIISDALTKETTFFD